MDDYETSPTMRYRDGGDVNHEDDGSEKGASTGSEGSEEFIKVEDVNVEDVIPSNLTSGDHVQPEPTTIDTKPHIHDISLDSKQKNCMESKMLEYLDSREDDFASEKALEDYYDQLPTETAPFSVPGCSGDDNSFAELDDFQAEVLEVEDNKQESQTPIYDEYSYPDSTPVLDPTQVLEPNVSVTPKEERTDRDLPEEFVIHDSLRSSEENDGDDDDDVLKPSEISDVERDETPVMVEDHPDLKKVTSPYPEMIRSTSSENDEMKMEDELLPAEDDLSFQGSSPSLVSKSFPIAPDFKYSSGGVVDLIHWRDVKLSAVVFSLTLLVLLSLTCFSVVAVFAYLALSLLTVTISFRLYKFILQTLNGTQHPNPFQGWLDTDITLSREQLHRYTDNLLVHFNKFLCLAKDLILVKKSIESLKFGVTMWALSYVGCCFNGLTLLIIDVILVFTLPPFYEKFQKPIDLHWGNFKQRIEDMNKMLRSKMPGFKPKTH